MPAPEGLADLPRPPFAAATQPLRWTVDTTRGVIVIALDPEVAPWSVGALAELSRRGFYGDLFWHRVVPGFVVQGGDPTGTGAGGPGFTLPGEPSFGPYARGAVGIADAGLHTGGSQWFIMHARAPHLEGRYTLVGEVIEGLDVATALTTDDRILSASVEPL
ncbi:MAG: peptidylprolyl isomerase [Myxococcales bacterium]|nr:peptidylprolyl isomerase [Myxococcales bacterium]